MNGILKTGISAVLIVLILKYAFKLAGNFFSALITLAIILVLVGIYKQVRNK